MEKKIEDEILIKSLDASLEGLVFKEFFSTFDELSDDMKRKYLTKVFPKIIQKLRELKETDGFKEKIPVLENSNRIFRNQMLYEESKEISLIYIEIIKEEALRILENEENRSGVIKVEDLIEKALKIARITHVSESSNINFDKIFEKIVEIFFQLGDLLSANTYYNRIEKIKNQNEVDRLVVAMRAGEIRRIERLESEKIAAASKRVEHLYWEESLKEQASMIKKKGNEALLERENELKKRKAFKRGHFKKALKKIKLKEYGESFELYKKSIVKLNNLQKYNLAVVSLAIASFLLILKDEFNEIEKLLADIKKYLSGF